MGTPDQWLKILALLKALFESTKAAINLEQTVEKYRHDRETIQESQRVSSVFSTYSAAEVERIFSLLEGCAKRFIDQGSGAARAKCVCSVLNEVKEGNGGQLPLIDDWENIYRQLGCHRFETSS